MIRELTLVSLLEYEIFIGNTVHIKQKIFAEVIMVLQ